ncbi:MAG: hypothetical protein ACRCZI_09380 [Cetobacterium sp.]
MRKLKKTDELNYKYKKIVQNILAIDESIFIDLIIDLYNITDLKSTFSFLVNHDFQHLIFEIMYLIKSYENNANFIIENIIKRNSSKIELSLNKLKIDSEEKFLELIKQDIPIYHSMNISDSMYIFYAHTSKNYNKQYYNLSLELLKQKKEEFYKKSKNKEFEKIVELEGTLKNSLVENELNMFLRKDYNLSKEEEDKHLDYISNILNGTRDKINKTITFDEGVGLFLHSNLEDMERMKKTFEVINIEITTLLNNSFKRFLDNSKDYYLLEEVNKIVLENKNLKSEIKIVKEKEVVIDESIEKENKQLQKENYYLKTKAENLELKIKELQEELNRNKEITENLEVEIEDRKIVKIDISDKKIVVLGGHWKSKKLTLNIKTIPAEDILKSIDSLKSYDIVIFDTSRNSHINYNKLKSVTKDFYLINKSSEEDILKIFETIL